MPMATPTPILTVTMLRSRMKLRKLIQAIEMKKPGHCGRAFLFAERVNERVSRSATANWRSSYRWGEGEWQHSKGSCLCGEVAFEVEGPFDAFLNCHCSRCRKRPGRRIRAR